jgi:hypothetical protein
MASAGQAMLPAADFHSAADDTAAAIMKMTSQHRKFHAGQ